MRRAALALLLLLAAVAGGCGLGAGESKEGGASLLVTRDFGDARARRRRGSTRSRAARP